MKVLLLRFLQFLLLLALAVGAFLVRCHNLRETFIEGHIYFIDDDCYSRMTRVRMISEGQAVIVRHHDFENYPAGIHSHATAPFDYLILATKWLLEAGFANRPWGRGSLLAPQTADLAGALVSPLLGAATCVFLAMWGWQLAGTFRLASRALRGVAAAAPGLLFAVSPIAVSATVLGRPDHQSLLVFLLAVALGAEGVLAGEGTKGTSESLTSLTSLGWPVTAGLAWGLALWVSLYEPAILLTLVAFFLTLFDPRALLLPARARRWEGGCLLATLLFFLLVEGWPVRPLAPEVVRYFPAWSHTVGELASLKLTDASFRHWLGWAFYLSPLLLAAAGWRDRRAWPWLLLFLATLGLTCWQLRWGYFLALVFSMTLPWQVAMLRRWWVAAPALVLALFGTAHAWELTLFPEGAAHDALLIKRRENVLLREIAPRITGPFLAPWWESPPLAYWSRQPGVAGSSHESLSGIVDVSRFYLDVHDTSAPEILRRRQVAFIVTDEESRLTGPALGLLGGTASALSLAHRLNDDAYNAEAYLQPVYSNLFFKVFAVDRAKLPP